MQQQKQEARQTPVTNVFADCKSIVTRTTYPKTLKKFFEYLVRLGLLPGAQEDDDVDAQGQAFLDLATQDLEYANRTIREYILENRKRVEAGEITAGTLKGLFTPIKIFCDGYDDITTTVNWKRIKKGMPTVQHFSDDRSPTKEEIKKVLEYPDRRIKSIVLIMATSGMRIGSFEGLKWKHIKPIYDDKETGEIVAAHLYVAKSKMGSYHTLITPETYREIEKYIEFRKMWGEQITDDSWVIRNDFKTADIKRNTPAENGGGINGRAETPRQLKVGAINRLLVRALYEQGLRESLEEGKKRHEWKTAHGYRKFFETTASYAGVHGLTFEMLMGHKTGLIANYMRPTQEMIIEEYKKAIPALTIYEDVQTLKKQQEVLEAKQEEKDVELEAMKQAYKDTTEMMQRMQNQVEEQNKKMLQMSDEMHTLGLVAQHYEKIAEEKEQEQEQKS